MAKNFPTVGKETNVQVQKAQRIPNKMNPNKSTLTHTITKVAKVNDKEMI